MVNCPKCGFNQPQDQYCAKCGVDMVAFKPAAKPLISQLISNITFQISVLAMVALVGGLYVRHANREKLARTIAETPIAREAEQQETELAAAQAALPDSSKASLQQTVSASIGDSQKEKQAAPEIAEAKATTGFVATSAPAAQATAAPQVASAMTGSHSAVGSATNIKVYFVEGQRRFLNSLLTESHQSSADGSFNFGVVTGFDKRLKASHTAWHSLDSSGNQAIHLNQPNVIFKGLRDTATAQNIGFTIQVIPISQDDAGTHLQVDANRVLRDGSGGLETFDFQLPESFIIPRDGALVLVGALPHRTLTEPEEKLYRSVNVLKAMSSETFRSGVTDVAIVVEAR